MELYTYSARLVKIVDGDTIDVDIDLGFGTWLHGKRLRLYGLDTPEKNTPEGVKAKQYTIDWLTKALAETSVVVKTLSDKPDKYGRILATVHDSKTSQSLNDALISSGNAKAYFGGKKE